MKRIFKRVILLSIFILLICLTKKTFATSISFSKNSINVGESVTIKVSVPNVNTCSVIANVSGAGTSGTIRVVDGSMSGSKQTYSNSITVTPTSAGTISVSVTGDSNAVADGQYVSVGASANLTVNNASSSSSSSDSNSSSNGNLSSSTSSNVAKLSNIKVSPVDFSGFKRDNPGPYRVTVENNVTSVKVKTTGLNGSKGVVSGGTNLQEGTNKITVTAYSGNKAGMIYTIFVTRKTAEGETVPNTIDEDVENEEEEKKELRLENIVLDDTLNVKLDPNFDPEVFEYTVTLGNDYLDLEKLLITAMANIEGATVTIDGNEDLIDGENIVTITVEAEGYETVWYRVKVIKGPVEETILTDTKVTEDDQNSKKRLVTKIIICILTVLIALIGIIFAIKDRRDSKKKKEGKREKNNSAWEDEPLINNYSFKDDEDAMSDDVGADVSVRPEEEPEHSNEQLSNVENNILEDVFKNKNTEDTSTQKPNDEYNDEKNVEINDHGDLQNEQTDLEKIKDEFFSAKRIEFEEAEEKPRRKRRGKGKHA